MSKKYIYIFFPLISEESSAVSLENGPQLGASQQWLSRTAQPHKWPSTVLELRTVTSVARKLRCDTRTDQTSGRGSSEVRANKGEKKILEQLLADMNSLSLFGNTENTEWFILIFPSGR